MTGAVYWAPVEQTWKLTFRHGAIVEHIDLIHFNGGPIGAKTAALAVADRWLATHGALRFDCPHCGVERGLPCLRPKNLTDPHAARVKLAIQGDR